MLQCSFSPDATGRSSQIHRYFTTCMEKWMEAGGAAYCRPLLLELRAIMLAWT
jgi:hypothetical protein